MIEQLTESLQPLTSWLLFASLKSVAIIPVVLLMQHIAARWLTPQGRYGLWFAVIACLSIPFGTPVQIGNALPDNQPLQSTIVPQPISTDASESFSQIVAAPATTISNVPLAAKLTLAWLAGAIMLSMAVVRSVSRYGRLKSRASAVDSSTAELFESCRQMLKFRRRVQLLESPQIESPVVVGYWRPTLLLPRSLSTQISSDQLRLVLLHELTHITRHDILANWLITLVQIAHWFNPLAWYALRSMRNDMEHACDGSVLQRLAPGERVAYGDMLIRLSDFTPKGTLLAQSASVLGRRSELRARIRMIAGFRSRGAASSLTAVALIALVSALAVTQAADAPPRPPVTAPAATPPPVVTTSVAQTAAAPRRPQRAASQATAPDRPTQAANKPENGAPDLESAAFPIRYALAKDMASIIEARSGSGFLSPKGSMTLDTNANAIVVRDTASNVSVIRQLIASLDVPLENVIIETVVAWADNDFIQELAAAGQYVPASVFEPGRGIISMLEEGQRANRAQIISRPTVSIPNRLQGWVQQPAEIPPRQEATPDTQARQPHLRLGFTPTVLPDRRLTLDIDISIRTESPSSAMATTPGNGLPPSVDTSQIKTQIILESGTTVMLDARNQGSERRLIAFVTPKLRPAVTAISR